MNKDDEVTNFKFYRVAYDHDRKGWCVWEQTKKNELIFAEGPVHDRQTAILLMRDLNKDQGFDIHGSSL